MNGSLINAQVSMHALQRKLDLLSHNIANVNTAGYKRKDATFHDLLTRYQSQTDDFEKAGRMTPIGLNMGSGSRLGVDWTDFSQGTLQQTDQPFDLAIEGPGMLEVQVVGFDADGNRQDTRGFVRGGNLQITDTNQGLALTDGNGHFVVGIDGNPIVLPADRRIVIDDSGRIEAYDDASGQPPVQVGQLKMVKVEKPERLIASGDNLYVLPEDPETNGPMAGVITEAALLNLPQSEWMNQQGLRIHQGFMEQSNVDLTREMTELVSVQRAYQLNARALSSSDTLMNLANNLRA
ncbi:flagellar hook-basal body protein [Marinicrinis sediminis]|uniref:Flagellar hook-basal body protein n=1 Tax=Marinicrinis sediminis TaxID=1652465 RepID=A0ABW5RBQ4_9BACL